MRGALGHLRRVAGLSTYGGTRWRAVLAGDPPRKLLTRSLRAYVGTSASIDFLGCYDMNRNQALQLAAHLERVRRLFAAW